MVNFKTRGKVSSENVNLLLNAMLVVARKQREPLLSYLKGNSLMVSESGHQPVYSCIYHYLRRLANYDMQYDNTHPAFSPWEDVEGKIQPARIRIVEYCGWTLAKNYYADGCNDTHWDTVQKQVKGLFVEELKKILN